MRFLRGLLAVFVVVVAVDVAVAFAVGPIGLQLLLLLLLVVVVLLLLLLPLTCQPRRRPKRDIVFMWKLFSVLPLPIDYIELYTTSARKQKK